MTVDRHRNKDLLQT